MKNIFLFIIFSSIFLLLYSLLFYPIVIWIFAKFKKQRRSIINNNNEILPHVSVVIAAHNEEKVIEQKIKNTLELDYPKDKIEILVGSDGSDDKTDEICQQYSDLIKFKRIEPRQGKPNTLNTLTQVAKGDIFLFTDANTILEEVSLRKMVAHFSDNSIGGVCGNLILKIKKKGLQAYEQVYWNYESKIKYLESQVWSTIASNGGIYVVRRELFKKIPKNTIIDDFWISLNILEQGRRIRFENEARAYENESENIVDEFWRKVRIGSGNLQTLIKRPAILNLTQKRFFLHVAYYSHKVIRWILPLLLPALYFSIVGLSSEPGFLIAFQLSNLFLLIAVLGILLEVESKTINYISYFTLVCFALLCGYVICLLGRQNVTWRRAVRGL